MLARNAELPGDFGDGKEALGLVGARGLVRHGLAGTPEFRRGRLGFVLDLDGLF